jgi:hypothetical protein
MEVRYIEERCINSDSAFDLLSTDHCYLLAYLKNERCFLFNYYQGDAEVIEDFN